MTILEKAQINACLGKYYEEHYGKCDNDIWFEQPAVNVWVFGREGKIITLKCHILTERVEEYIEK